MNVRLLSIGKPRDRQFALLHDQYAERLRRLGVGYVTDWVPDVPPTGPSGEEQAREREAQSVLLRLDRESARGTIVALAAEGELLSSAELARRLERWATRCASFVVGGPLGLHRRILDRADARWSLSPLTFPHELVRGLIAEQLYRAVTLLRGFPYHR